MRAAGRPLVALALAAAVLAAPAPRAAGQGSSGIVGVTSIGSGAEETWVFLPGEDPPTCLVVFLHGAGDPTPSRYLGWLDHLALDAACAVIFPRYQVARNTAPTTLGGLRAGVSAGVGHVRRARFGFEGRRVPKKLRTVVVGVGLGGNLAFYYAANAKHWGLPVPAAIDSIFPTSASIRGVPLEPVPHGTRVLVQTRGGDRDVRAYLAPHPASRKRFQTVRSPANAPLQTTPFAINTFWAPVDELIG
jgi:hypothetical protein